MDLSVILVNYKSAGLLTDCLKSIYAETSQHDFEIIVVDNDSGDDSRETVLTLFPRVRWIQLDYNSGFSRANNEGIKEATGEFILLLNTDTIIKEQALDKTVALFKSHESYVACGVQLLNADGSHQFSGAHVVTGGLNTLLPLPYLGRFVRYWGYKLKTRVPGVSAVPEMQDVDWIVGAFLMVKKNVLAKSGLLDPDFFMYAEEMEWCSRLKKHGKLCLFGRPRVIHLGGGTSSEFYDEKEAWDNGKNLWNRKGRQIMVSTFLRIRKEFGVLWFLVILGFYIGDIPVFFIGILIEKIIRGKSRYNWNNLTEYIRNIGVSLSYFFKMLFNRPYFYKVN